MNFETLILEIEDRLAVIALNRPEKRNAISFRLVDDLIAALDEIEKSAAQIVILTGAGKAFCAGMDLDELKSLTGKTHRGKCRRLSPDGKALSSYLRISKTNYCGG